MLAEAFLLAVSDSRRLPGKAGLYGVFCSTGSGVKIILPGVWVYSNRIVDKARSEEKGKDLVSNLHTIKSFDSK